MSRRLIEISGFAEIKSKLMMLANDKSKRSEALIVLRQIAKPSLSAARNLAPVSKKPHVARGKVVQPETLKKSLGLITGKSPDPTIYVGPRAKGSYDGWYGHFVHDGHAVYNNPDNAKKLLKSGKRKSVLSRITNKRKGSVSKNVQGYPYLDIAYAQTNGSMTAEAEAKFSAFIQKRIKKLGL